MDAAPGEELCFHGVTLARFAAVRAALAEPFGLGRVLAVEGLDREAFRAADIEWKTRLARDPKGLFPRYQVELAAAEDWLMRIVSPLHEDIEAWVDFQCAFALKPADVLRVAGMSMNDVSRLTRFWSAQCERDGSLAERAARRRKRGAAGLPRIAAEPRQLRRSRAAGAHPAEARPAPVALQSLPVAALQSPPPPGERSPPSERPAPAVHIEVPSFLAAQARAAEALPAPVMEAPPAHRDAGGTRAVAAFVAEPALPFAGRPSAPPAAPDAAPPPAPDMPLTQYASLCVDLGDRPERAAETLSRYRLTAELKKAVDARYRERFVSDPRLFGEFRRACDAYHAWLAEQASAARVSAPPPVSQRASAAPPGPAARVSVPPFTVDQYAALVVDLQIAPAYRAATLHNHGLTEAQAAALDAAWRQRLSVDGAAYAAYQWAAAAHHAWRAGGGR